VVVFEIENYTLQVKAPLYKAVQNFLGKRQLSFHVPLHGGGAGALPLMKRVFGSYMRWDLTELDGLDDLHLPLEAIREAQELAAGLFQAAETFFLVNGVTAGLLALFLAFCQPGDKVLLSRIAHKAALHGILLAGALPVYLPVEQEPVTGFPLNISPLLVEKALGEHPDAKILLLTSPSYWGVAADLPGIKKITDKYRVMLVVDEAHGAHLPFCPQYIPHSAAAKADIWLHSAHKTLGALTPGAFLHLGNKKDALLLKFWLQTLQTSSPSYPLMVSLDLARRQAALRGEEIFSRSWRWALRLRHELEKRGFKILSPALVQQEGFALDPCRITLLFPGGGGLHLAAIMGSNYQLQVELKDHGYILMITGPSNLSISPTLVARAIARSRHLLSYLKHPPKNTSPISDFSPTIFRTGPSFPSGGEGYTFPPFCLPPGIAFNSPSRAISLEKSPGEVCSEMVVLSPPGIPVLSPGERITGEVCDFLLQKRAEGRYFQGAADHTLQKIRVVSG
jgi:arginine decarboxylase